MSFYTLRPAPDLYVYPSIASMVLVDSVWYDLYDWEYANGSEWLGEPIPEQMETAQAFLLSTGLYLCSYWITES